MADTLNTKSTTDATAQAEEVSLNRLAGMFDHWFRKSLPREPRITKDWYIEYGYPIRFPSIEVLTIGAGGGSIAWLDEQKRLHVGPRSAGSTPGPVCYGRGGTEPTVTDANLLLGRAVLGRYLGRFDRSRADYDAILAADPHHADALKGRRELSREAPRPDGRKSLQLEDAFDLEQERQAGLDH